jgi:hypothetical protein
MSARVELNSYLEQLQKRLKRQAWLRGIAILTGAALLFTIALVIIANHFAFSDGSLWSARAILFFVLALGIAFGLAVPLWRLTRRHVSGIAETANPAFDQRLITFTEREAQGTDPFIELLAADTMRHTRNADPQALVPNAKMMSAFGIGVASLGLLVWMILWGPGFLGYGSALLWMGGRGNVAPMYDLRVTPGNTTVRKNADELVTAVPIGLQADRVSIFARYQNSTKWNEVPMQTQQNGNGYQFLFAGLPASVEYYVVAGPLKSPHYNLKVVDVAGVKQIRVTYHYPSWTGMPASTDEHGGDLHALQGTQADLEVVTDRPLTNGLLVVNDKDVQLSGGQGNVYHGSIAIDKDGVYHVGTVDDGQPVRLSEDYFIEADKPNAPDVALTRPGRDYQASPIEEVTLQAKADDDFGLTGFALHYSVNGGPEKSIDLLKQKGAKTADGSSVLSLENFKVAPGDVISVYATANDARTQSRTDIYFIQAEPFDFEFTQSQSGGGSGGGAGNQGDQISQREKEIIGSTWKEVGQPGASAQQNTENAKFLSDVQSKLRDQAVSLAGRLQSRDIPSTNEEFGSFEQDMTTAAQAMGPAADKLKSQQWKEAIPNEEKALQALLRAEATIRQIEVAYQSGGGGGSGGGGSAGRDLQSLFDLELDTAKNQYETAQTAQDSQDAQAQQIDDALKKLDELAKRQEGLAGQQSAANQPDQRWQQEMLRRQAEQLQQQLQQLAQNQNSQNSPNNSQSGSQSSQSASQNGSQSSSPNGSQGNSSQQSSDAARAQQALEQLRQANDDMRQADQNPGGADARRAADRLRQAQSDLAGMQRQESAGTLDSLANEADRLSSQEQSQSSQLQQLEQEAQRLNNGNGSQQDYAKAEGELQNLLNERQKQADDLSKLETGLRDAERQAASSDRATASKLRDALSNLDENDLKTEIQRSADRLRTGYVPTDDDTERQIVAGMQQLSQQVHQAQQSAANGPQGQGQESDLNRIEDLRSRLEALDRNLNGNGLSRQGQNQNGQQGQNGQLSRNGQNGQQGQNGQAGQNGQQGGQQARNGQQQGQGGQLARNGSPGGGGPYGGNSPNAGYNTGPYGGNYVRNNVNGGWLDTGGNTNPNPAGHLDNGSEPLNSPADQQAAIDQGLNELSQLRQDVANDPATAAQVDALIKELSALDPRRFPGNPAMVDELHNRVLNDVDRLQLEMQSKSDGADQSGQVRSTDPMPVPAGYQDAVSEYFRKLSKNP